MMQAVDLISKGVLHAPRVESEREERLRPAHRVHGRDSGADKEKCGKRVDGGVAGTGRVGENLRVVLGKGKVSSGCAAY